MALRLLSFPELQATAVTPISGPNARNSGANTASDGGEQTFDTLGDVVAVRVAFPPRIGAGARRERGAMTALLSGANALRFDCPDPDRMSVVEAGGSTNGALNWTDGNSWSDGTQWQAGYPEVAVAIAAALDDGIVNLADQYWGYNLGYGDVIGFTPFHFGRYMVTEVLDEGEYRIWPRLRKAITTATFATLRPVAAMRPAGRDAVSLGRGLSSTEGQGVTLVEVFDYYVRDYYTG